MTPVKPQITIEGDSADTVMAKSGWIVGFANLHPHHPHRVLVVWCFGFLANTPAAKAYGVSVEKQIWILADAEGRIENTFHGKKDQLPLRFKAVLTL